MSRVTIVVGVVSLGALAGPAVVRSQNGAIPPPGLAAVPSQAETLTDSDPDNEDDQHQNGQVRRDPFRPISLDLRPHQPMEPLTPLQEYELQQLTVTGIVCNVRPPIAIVEDDAGMGFIVTPGTLIGGQHGVVKAIEPGRIIVDQETIDAYGQVRRQHIVMEMPKDGERHRDVPQRASQGASRPGGLATTTR